MPENAQRNWLDWLQWRAVLINAVAVVLLLSVVIILLAVYGQGLFNKPPVSVVRKDPEHLGILCPNQFAPVHNRITTTDPMVAIYYITIMDKTGMINIFGHQEVFSGFQHPIPGTFDQVFPWNVPDDLPPDNYVRGFAARGTDGDEQTVFITSTFTLKEEGDCTDEQ